jgi:hypothetical protein
MFEKQDFLVRMHPIQGYRGIKFRRTLGDALRPNITDR